MTIDQIKTLVAVVHHGSMRKAAKALGKSQPAVSATIHRLESSLGCALIVKGSRPVKLSSFGSRFLKRAREFDDVLGLTETFAKQNAMKKLCVCFDYGIALDEVCKVSLQIIRDNPLRSLDLFRVDTETIHQLLIKKRCDLALTQPMKFLPPYLETQDVGEREFVEIQSVVAPENQPRSMYVHNSHGQPLWDFLVMNPSNAISFNRPSDMLEAVSRFHGKGWLPKGEVQAALNCGEVRLTEQPRQSCSFHIVWQRSLAGESKLIKRIIRLM